MARQRSFRRRQGNGSLWAGLAIGVISLGALGLLVSQSRGTNVGGVGGLVGDVSAVVGHVLSVPVRAADSAISFVSSYLNSAQKVRALEDEVESLAAYRSEAIALRERVSSFEGLALMASGAVQGGVIARIVGENNGPFTRAGLINVGRADGIDVNWIAFNQYGMVGRVVAVGPNSARILLLTDSASRVPVMGEETRSRAIVVGDKTAAPQLQHLNLPPRMANEERVMTSGDDGLIPRGLAVGTASVAPDGRWRVRLASDRAPVDFVTLIAPSVIVAPPDPVTQPEFEPAEAEDLGATEDLPVAEGAAVVVDEATPEAIAAAQEQAAADREARQAAEAERDAAEAEAARQSRAAAEQRRRTQARDQAKEGEPTKAAAPSPVRPMGEGGTPVPGIAAPRQNPNPAPPSQSPANRASSPTPAQQTSPPPATPAPPPPAEEQPPPEGAQ